MSYNPVRHIEVKAKRYLVSCHIWGFLLCVCSLQTILETALSTLYCEIETVLNSYFYRCKAY